MARRFKPSVNTNPVANQYTGAMERIIEFSTATGPGGLISIMDHGDGRVTVQAYRLDPGITVISGKNREE